MRVMFAVAVLLSGIACIGEAEAQACGDRDCDRCLVYARGECVKRGSDPACEARKRNVWRGQVRKIGSDLLRDRLATASAANTTRRPQSAPTVVHRHRLLCTDRNRHRLLCDRHRLLHRHPASYLPEYICAPPTYRHPQLVHMALWPFVPNRRRQIGNGYSGHALPTARVCRHRKRCPALSHQAIKCSRSGPSTNPTQATH
jgi:hypothetical protein